MRKEWETDQVVVREEDFNFDLKKFVVENYGGKVLGEIIPGTMDVDQIREDLDEGGCPIRDNWEDGMGNTCSLNGWGS